MKTLNSEEFEKYLDANYPSVFESSTYDINGNLGELEQVCSACQRHVFFKISARYHSRNHHGASDDLPNFVTALFDCPNCRSKAFHQYVITQVSKAIENEDDEESFETVYRFHRLYRLPTGNEHFTNSEIPDEFPTLKTTVQEALFCLSHSRNIAAVILFRRAIQMICKEILGAPGGRNSTLNSQLKWLKENENKLKINLDEVFHDNAAIIKEMGNQGAHPDDDVELHDFSKQDAEDVHNLFVSIIHEIFTKPARIKEMQEELRARRKLR